MASIRIRNKAVSGGIPGLTKGELAVNLADAVLWVGGTTDTPIYLSGVQTFNGLTGAVTGVTVGGANVFTQLNTFQAGISASSATLGTLVVNNGISAAGGITFNSLSHFTKGLSGSGATLGTLVVNSGISASGGVTFHNNVWVGGLLTANGGISAAGGVTFANTLYVGQTLGVGSDISYSGKLVKNGIAQYTMQSVGTTSDLRYLSGVTTGDVVYVNGPAGYDGLYVLRLINNTIPPLGPVWARLNGNTPADVNGDGIIDSYDLAAVLAGWGDADDVYGWSGTPLTMAITDNNGDAFEVKVYGATAGKKTSAFKITSNDPLVPQIFMKAGTVDVDGGLKVQDFTAGMNQVALIEGGQFANYPILRVRSLNADLDPIVAGWSEFMCGVCFAGGVSFSGPVFMGASAPVRMGGLLTLNSGLSAGCGVTFNCLTHFTQGLSASGATLGTLVVNGGATFNGPVYMGVTLTMNSNIKFNSGYGINAGFVDAGWY